MIGDINTVTLCGNLVEDPVLRAQASGDFVVSLRMGTSSRRKDKEGNWTEESQYHNVVVFGGAAQIIKDDCKKGSKICVIGRLRYREYEKDGQKRYVTEIVANNIALVSAKRDEADE